MKEGTSLNEAKVKAAIKGKGLVFESMETTQITRPKVAYELVVTGAT